MNLANFEEVSMYIGVFVLIAFMFFIIFDLGRRSGAGKFGTMILLIGLGVGMMGFIIKEVLIRVLDI